MRRLHITWHQGRDREPQNQKGTGLQVIICTLGLHADSTDHLIYKDKCHNCLHLYSITFLVQKSPTPNLTCQNYAKTPEAN